MTQKIIYRWLLFVGLGHVLLGILFILIAQSSLINFYLEHLQQAFSTDLSAQEESLVRTLLQLFGPTVASWGLLFCIATYSFVQQGKLAIKWALMLAVLIWFVLDSGLSLYMSLYYHLIINLVAAASIVIPLLLLKAQPSPVAVTANTPGT